MTDLTEKVARAIESAFGKSLHGAATAAIAAVREAEADEIGRLRAVLAAAKEFDEALDIPGANVGKARYEMHKAICAALQETPHD